MVRIKQAKRRGTMKANEKLLESLCQLEDDLRTSKQLSAEERHRQKLAYITGQEKVVPDLDFLSAPSQPETVRELDEEDEVSSDDMKSNLSDIESIRGKRKKHESFLSISDSLIEQLSSKKYSQWRLESMLGVPIDDD